MWSALVELDVRGLYIALRTMVSLDQVRQIIYAAVKDDKRYADFKRDYSRNQNMDINVMKMHLLEAARECGDLVCVSQAAYNPMVKKVAEQPKKGGNGQSAHPSPKGTASPDTAADGGAPHTARDGSKSALHPCMNFIHGSCRRGDACNRLHITLDVFVAEVETVSYTHLTLPTKRIV